MVKLLTCAHGHFWEVEEADANGDTAHAVDVLPRQICPACGSGAELMPDIDLAPSEMPIAEAAPLEALPAPPPLRDADGRPVVAGYEIVADLGRTPRGVLAYQAKQTLVNRIVTLKVVFAKDDPGQRAWGCLRGEATALGKLLHPNIVQIFEVGERERQLFYNAVEFVDGLTLAEKVQGKPLKPRQAAIVVETLARAVQAAHDKGLLHRSLKAASVFVIGKAKTPIDQCVLKITDFGQAGRPTEGDINDVDLQGPLPFYLSPEQAWGRVKDFGPPTDVYALGAIFFELLTGRPPFQANDWLIMVEKIQGKEAPSPSEIQRRVPRELDSICRKCLVKNPRRRYRSVQELADDLRLYLDGFPIKARATSGARRFGKWVKRRPLVAVVVLLTMAALASTLTAYIIGGGGLDPRAQATSPWIQKGPIQETDSLNARLREARAAERAATYFRRITAADRAATEKNPALLTILNECPNEQQHWEWFYLRNIATQNGPALTVLRTGNKPILDLALSVDGHSVAVGTDVDTGGDKKAAVYVWSTTDGRGLPLTREYDGPVVALAINAKGDALAVALNKPANAGGSRIIVRGMPGGETRHDFEVPEARVTSLQYSRYREYSGRGGNQVAPDSFEVLGMGRNDGQVWFWRTKEAFGLNVAPIMFVLNARNDPNRLRLAFSPSTQQIAACSQSGRVVQIQDNPYSSEQRPISLPGNTSTECVAFNTDNRLAVGCGDGTVALFDANLTTSQTLRGHTGSVNALAFSADGKRMATASADKTVKVWETATGLEILTLKDMPAAPVGLAFTPDNRRLIVATGNEVRFYGSGKP